jgi:hypothetical protein
MGSVIGDILLPAIRKWQKQPKEDEEPALPKRIAPVGRFTAPKASGLAAVLGGVNSKDLLLTAAGATAIAQVALSTGSSFAALTVFVLFASVSIAASLPYRPTGSEKAAACGGGRPGWRGATPSSCRSLFLCSASSSLAKALARCSASLA